VEGDRRPEPFLALGVRSPSKVSVLFTEYETDAEDGRSMRRAGVLFRVLFAVVAVSLAASCAGGASAIRDTTPGPPPPSYVASWGQGWVRSFDAGFTGARLDTSAWGTCYPWQSPDGCTNFGNSDEYEWYTPSQDKVYGGALHLVAERIPTHGLASSGSSKEYAFRSGMVTTFPGFRFQYGYIQVVARIPYGPGLWPAFWLAAADEQWPPEIDILEHYGTQKQFYEHLHPVASRAQEGSETVPDLSVGWHVFGLYWSPYRIVWFVDGRPVMSSRTGIPQQPMYFIANLAVYQQVETGWSGSAYAMIIRSVKVWQAKTYTGQEICPQCGEERGALSTQRHLANPDRVLNVVNRRLPCVSPTYRRRLRIL
jgi:beta-glucanase (GH16 family)